MMLSFTEFVADRPIGKAFDLDAAGDLLKSTKGTFAGGSYVVRTLAGLAAFADFLNAARPGATISASLPRDGVASSPIVLKAQRGSGRKARCKDDFGLMAGVPGLMTIDYDPPAGRAPLSRTELLDVLCAAVPALRGVGCVVTDSSGSWIYSDSGTLLRGAGGLRVYYHVLDASDVPRALRVLADRCWLSGAGRFEISSNGRLLERGPVDLALAADAHLDYCGGAHCGPGVVQRRPASVIVGGGVDVFDTAGLLPDLTDDEARRLDALRCAERDRLSPEAAVRRAAWEAEHVTRATAAFLTAGDSLDVAQERAVRLVRNAQNSVLEGDWPIVLADGRTLTVREILDRRDEFHRAPCLDPLTPEYADGKVCGIIYTDGKAGIYSHAHGGTWYRLQRQPTAFEVRRGDDVRLVSELLTWIGAEDDIFRRADRVVSLGADGGARVLDRRGIQFLTGSRCELFRTDADGKGRYPANLPDAVSDMVLNEGAQTSGGLRDLVAVWPAPFVGLDGSITARFGFDSSSGVFCAFRDDLPEIPEKPSEAEIIEALRTLWRPWSLYQWEADDDRAAMLSAILTALIRPGLDISPGWFLDAARAGSGKTQAASAVLALIAGSVPGALNWVDDAETGKLLVAVIRNGAPGVLLDNIRGTFQDVSLEALFTSPVFKRRLLGGHGEFAAPHRLMVVCTGNNANVGADLGRRLIRPRIRVDVERPNERKFAFSPVDAVLRDRAAILHAGLVVWRAWFAAGKPGHDLGGCGFPAWDATVRALVVWLADWSFVAGVGALGDPARSIVEGSEDADPEAEALSVLLQGLAEQFGDDRFTVGGVLNAARADGCGAVAEGLEGLLGREVRNMTTQAVGAALRNRRDRVTGGWVLRAQGKDRDRRPLWSVGQP